MKVWLLSSVMLSVLLSEIFSLKCAPTACDNVKCEPVECRAGEVRGKGKHCLCCDVCRTVIGENVFCGSNSPIGGVISDTVTCDKGLICYKDKCQREEVILSQITDT